MTKSGLIGTLVFVYQLLGVSPFSSFFDIAKSNPRAYSTQNYRPPVISYIYKDLIPFPLEFYAEIDNQMVGLSLISVGNAGPTYLTEDRTRIIKLAYQASDSLAISNAQRELLNDAKKLFREKHQLLVMLQEDAGSVPALAPLAKFLVPTREVALRYDGQTYTALEKEYIGGATLLSLYQGVGSLSMSTDVQNALSELYDAYSLATTSQYYIFDLHDKNIIYAPSKNPSIIIIDGAYDGYYYDNFPKAMFRKNCLEAIWCAPFVKNDSYFNPAVF